MYKIARLISFFTSSHTNSNVLSIILTNERPIHKSTAVC